MYTVLTRRVGIKRGYGCGTDGGYGWRIWKADEKIRLGDETRMRKCGWR